MAGLRGRDCGVESKGGGDDAAEGGYQGVAARPLAKGASIHLSKVPCRETALNIVDKQNIVQSQIEKRAPKGYQHHPPPPRRPILLENPIPQFTP